MGAEQNQCPLIFKHIPNVYSRLPSPNGTSGQRSGPVRLSKSTMKLVPGEKSTSVILAVSAQLARFGASTIVAWLKLNSWTWNDNAGMYALVTPFAGSVTLTRQ